MPAASEKKEIRRSAGDVADVAVLRRHREQLPPGREDHPLSAWGDVEGLHVLGDVLEVARPVGEVPGEGDGELPGLPGLGVQVVEVAAVLEDDTSHPAARPHHVVLGEPGHLRLRSGPGVVDPEVQLLLLVPVAHEVDLVPHPEGEVVGAGLGGDALAGLVGQVVDPHVLLPAGAVSLPVPPLPALDVVRQPGAGGVEGRPRGTFRNLQGHLETTVHRIHQVVPTDPLPEGRPVGPDQDLRSVGGPIQDQMVVAAPGRHGAHVRIEGELPGLAPRRGHDVDLAGPGVLAGEGDPAAVRAEAGEELEPLVGGQPLRLAAGEGSRVQIPGVGEDHRVAVYVGEAEKAGLFLGRSPVRPDQKEDGRSQERRWESRSAHESVHPSEVERNAGSAPVS